MRRPTADAVFSVAMFQLEGFPSSEAAIWLMIPFPQKKVHRPKGSRAAPEQSSAAH